MDDYQQAAAQYEQAIWARRKAREALDQASAAFDEASEAEAHAEIALRAFESSPGIPLPQYRQETAS